MGDGNNHGSSMQGDIVLACLGCYDKILQME